WEKAFNLANGLKQERKGLMTQIMEATGLEKGGIYRHFRTKDEIAYASFDYYASMINTRLLEEVVKKENAVSKLITVIKTFQEIITSPNFTGGCPILNTTVETDDKDPVFCGKVQDVVNSWQQLITETVNNGIKSGQIQPTVDPDALFSVIISTMEGSVMLSKLYNDPKYINYSVNHLINYLEGSIRQ
ncbi:MAG: TetR/AcrR family transcriptional regulator, partial [Paenibacillaceae bacterium]